MPIDIKRLDSERIILLTYHGFIDVDDQKEAFQQTRDLIRDTDGVFYRIVDCTRAHTSLNEITRMIRNASQGQRGATTDPLIRVVIVGPGSKEKLFIDAMEAEKYGGVKIPHFQTLQDALDYVRTQLENLNTSSDV